MGEATATRPRATVVTIPKSVKIVVRRAPALQRTPDRADALLRVNPATATRLGLQSGSRVDASQDGRRCTLQLELDARVADGTCMLHGGHPDTAALGAWFGEISLVPAAGR